MFKELVNANSYKIRGWVGRECTGKARIKTHRPDKNPPDGGPRHMAPCQGDAPCLYCKEDIVAGVITWGQVNPAREQCPLPDGAPAQG